MKRLFCLFLLLPCLSFGQLIISPAGGGGGGGDALTTNPLSQFASTTSLQLKGVISDETGSGALVFATAPTIAGGTVTALTGLGIRSTGAAFDLTLASAEVFTAGRTLTISLGDAARTLTLSGSPTLSGITTTGTGTLAMGTKNLTVSNTLTLAGTDSTTMTFPTTSATIARTDAAQTFTGVQTFSSPVVGTQSALDNSTKAASTAYVDGPTNHGGWTELYVSGSNFTTTNLTLTDITGLITGTLANSTTYEIEVCLYLINAADTTGIKIGWHAGGSGTAASGALVGVATAATTNAISGFGCPVDTLSAAMDSVTSGSGVFRGGGLVVTPSAGTATLSIQVAKVTSNTATVKTGSVFRYRVAGQ